MAVQRLVKYIAIALGAFALTIATSRIERLGPDQAVYCALGKSVDGHQIWCPEPVLNAGWPAPYLYDTPGISVERKLHFMEDSLRTGPFLADSAFFALLLIGLSRIFSKVSKALRRSGRSGAGGIGSPRS